jgi:hypothetical protein
MIFVGYIGGSIYLNTFFIITKKKRGDNNQVTNTSGSFLSSTSVLIEPVQFED